MTVQYGEPFRFEACRESTREQQQEVADYILERIQELHAELAGRPAGRARAARAHHRLATAERGQRLHGIKA